MFQTLVVPLDGSPLAEKALPFAQFIAQKNAGRLVIVHAIETWGSSLHEELENELDLKRQAQGEVEAAAARTREAGITTDIQLFTGEAAATIGLVAEEHHADLIVMSTHGRSGLARWAYGSVAERVLHLKGLPVLLVPNHNEITWPPDRPSSVIVPLDGSAIAEQALQPAIELARLLGAGVSLVRVVEPPNLSLYAGYPIPPYPALDLQKEGRDAAPYLHDAAKQVQAGGVEASVETLIGYAASSIMNLAASKKAPAIVMASHGRTGLARAFMGSVAIGIVQRATSPVLVIRPAGLKEANDSPAGTPV